MAVCSQIHTKPINTVCGQNVELFYVKLAVHIVTTQEADHIYSFHTSTCPNSYGFRHPSQLPCVLLAKPRDEISASSVCPFKSLPHSLRHNRKRRWRRSTASDEWRDELQLTQAAIIQIIHFHRVWLPVISGRHRGWVGRLHHWLQLWLVHTWEGVS